MPPFLVAGVVLVLTPIASTRAATPAPEDSHLTFGSACPDVSGDPLRVVITTTPEGPKVTLTRPGKDPGPFETRDVNFAHVSRRVFFKARTEEGLIEFQGHARKEALVGLLSDDRGATRTIRLPALVDTSRQDCTR